MSGIKILVVEDEEIMAFDLETTLKKLGYEVTAVVSSEREAISQVECNLPNLIFMNIMAKNGMNGIQTGEKIRKRFNLPIIYLTASTDRKSLDKATEKQPFSFLLKPYQEREIITTIEIALARHEAEIKINQAWLKEKEINQLKANFITAASHEFRTPLTTISSSIDLLEIYSKEDLDERKAKHFARIHHLIGDMTKLLDDLLLLSQIESNQLTIKFEPLDIVHFCQNLVADVQDKRQRKINLNLTSLELDLKVKFDRQLLQLILSNLLDNAIKYSTQEQAIYLKIENQREEMFFYIQDQGIGICTEEKMMIFESFYRGSNVGNINGRGLGLTIVKNCVKLHGGQINIESKLAQGTKVIVKLPLSYYINHQ